MKNVLTFWLAKGADGFRIDAVNHLFEDSAMRNEPLSGKTNDPANYAYTHHIYTKDMVRRLTFRKVFPSHELISGGDVQHGGRVEAAN